MIGHDWPPEARETLAKLHSDHAAEVAKLTATNARLEATNADLCLAICRDPLLGQKLGIDLASTVRTAAHEAAIGINAQGSADATKLEDERDAALTALEGVRKALRNAQTDLEAFVDPLRSMADRVSRVDSALSTLRALSALPADGGGK